MKSIITLIFSDNMEFQGSEFVADTERQEQALCLILEKIS
jgi:hypothetical protein